MSDEGAPALLAAARSLWPGADVDQAAHRSAPGRRYALVPNARRAQLLVPLTPPAAAATAVRRFSAASSGRDVVARLTAAGASRATRAGVFRDRVVVRPGTDADALRDHLGRVLGQPVDFALGVGPARVNRKPVLQVFDERGRTVAFAKVGDSAQARADVRAETRALRSLAGHDFDLLAVPEVLDTSTWNGMDVLVMSALRAPAPWGRGAAELLPLGAMQELSQAYAEPAAPLGRLGWWRRQHDVAVGVGELELRRRLVRCLAVLDTRHSTTRVEVGAWHGDWTPWNMARHRSRVLLWDWERFETGVPVGHDAWHYRVQSATRRHGLDVTVVLAALAGSPSGQGRLGLLADLYLVAVALRYASLLGAERGADIEHATRVVTEALEIRVLGRSPVTGRAAERCAPGR